MAGGATGGRDHVCEGLSVDTARGSGASCRQDKSKHEALMKRLIIAAAFALSSTVILSGPAAAQEDAFNRALSADERGDYVEAAKWYRLAAEQGIAGAQYNLGVMYDNGEGVSENDAEAAKWYRRAADQGHALAQYNLGLMHDNGEGVPENDAEAVKWYRRAAAQGNAKAQHNLGIMYDKGEGVLENDAEAVKWYRRAADQGRAKAQGNLGGMYANGEGVPEDDVQAYMWLNLSAAQGDETAIANKDVMRKLMTPEQIAEAQKLSAEWKPVSER
jgi:TPR repeat protein